MTQHQALAWVLLTTFTQVYNESWSEKSEKQSLKNLNFGPKSDICKAEVKSLVVEKIAIKKKPSTWYRNEKEDALRISQE